MSAKVESDVQHGLARHEAENRRMHEIVSTVHAHCYYSILNCFTTALRELHSTSPEVSSVLKRLRDLFALSTLQQYIGGIAIDGYVSEAQADMLGETIQRLLEQLRPDAVALVDAFDFDDVLELHQTAVGAYDGDVYQRLWDWSEKDPANNAVEGRDSGTLPTMFTERWRPLLDYYKVDQSQHVAGQVGAIESRAKL